MISLTSLLKSAYEVIYQVFTFFYRYAKVYAICYLFFLSVQDLDFKWSKYLTIAAFFGGLVIALEEQGIFQFLIKKWRNKK